MTDERKENDDEKWSKKLNGYFIAFCRKTFRWSPAAREARKAALVKREGKTEIYRCHNCRELVERDNTHVDHHYPVVDPRTGFSGDWNQYRDRMFVGPDKLNVLCKPCHKIKTKKENEERKKWRKKKAA